MRISDWSSDVCSSDLLIMANQEALAALLTREQGKPLAEARGEIAYAANFIEWFAEEAKRVYGDVLPSHAGDKRIVVLKQPIGVVAAVDRQSVVWGQRVSGRVDLGGRGIINKKKNK